MPNPEQHNVYPIVSEAVPRVLKDALLYNDKEPSEELAQRRSAMVDHVMAGDSMQDLFPEISLNPVADRLLRVMTSREVALGQVILGQKEMRQNHPVLIASLTANLNDEQQSAFDQQFTRFSETASEEHIDTLLRRFNGEDRGHLLKEGESTHACLKRYKRSLALWNEQYRGDIPITEDLVAAFPPRHFSIATRLPEHLERINSESALLAQRMSPTDFDALANTFSDANLHAGYVAGILADLNRLPRSAKGVSRDYELVNLCRLARTQYDRYYPGLVEAWSIRRTDPSLSAPAPRPAVYEHGDHASKLILEALTTPTIDPLPKEEIITQAKTLEAGVYAQKLLEQRQDVQVVPELPAHSEVTDEELGELAALGQTALVTLLASNIGWVKKLAVRQSRFLGNPEDQATHDMAGMRGLLRAVRKFDYKTGALSTYSKNWIGTFVQRDVYKNDWNVSQEVGESITSVMLSRLRLQASLEREPQIDEIAADIGQPPARVSELLVLSQQLRYGTDSKKDVTAMATTEPPAGRIISFTPEVKETLAQVFEGQPLYPRILELRFGQHAEMAEISEALQLPVGMVASSMQEALSKLLDQFSKQELQDLLARD